MTGTTPALFLDRDGVINVDHGYVHRIDQVEFVSGIFDLCRMAVRRGFDIVVVTNQAGIGRGLYSEADFQELTRWMLARFESEGVPIRAVYHCPYHPEHGIGEFRAESPDRKPNPGMFLRAQADLALYPAASVAIGDKASDLAAARSAGIPHRMLLRATATSETADDATHVVASLDEAAAFLRDFEFPPPEATAAPSGGNGAPDLEQCRAALQSAGYLVEQVVPVTAGIADADLYRHFFNTWATFQPWLGDPLIENLVRTLQRAGRLTLVSRDRLWVLMQSFEQTRGLAGEVWEAGVFQGGTALLFRWLSLRALPGCSTRLRLFDTFAGMPRTVDDVDLHKEGDFSDTSLDAVKSLVGTEDWIDYRPGLVPDTFAGLADCTVRLAHVDLDIYEGILSACEFIYPRLVPGGMMVFDDYGFWTCPGARAAVDQFFADKPERPLALPTGQAIMTRLPPAGTAPAPSTQTRADALAP